MGFRFSDRPIMVDGGFLVALTNILQNEAVKETVGENSEKIVDLTH